MSCNPEVLEDRPAAENSRTDPVTPQCNAVDGFTLQVVADNPHHNVTRSKPAGSSSIPWHATF